MRFKQMENISNFLKGCRKLGVVERDLFCTVHTLEICATARADTGGVNAADARSA